MPVMKGSIFGNFPKIQLKQSLNFNTLSAFEQNLLQFLEDDAEKEQAAASTAAGKVNNFYQKNLIWKSRNSYNIFLSPKKFLVT